MKGINLAVLLAIVVGFACSSVRAQIPVEECSPPVVNQLVFDASCRDAVAELADAGRGRTMVSTYGAIERHLPLPVVATGMSGVGELYHRLLIVDPTYTSFADEIVDLKEWDGGALPIPNLGADALAEGGFQVQPRPGTMPGAHILQVDSTYYQYGGPLDTGASPQTTAVFADPFGGAAFAPSYPFPNNLSGALLYRLGTAPNEYLEVRHVDGTVARFDWFQPYGSGWSPPSNRTLWRVTSVRDPYDNLTTYVYNSLDQLTTIQFPSGVWQHFSYAPAWQWGGNFDCLEIRYSQGGATPAPSELAARTWGLVFEAGGSASVYGRFFGARLRFTYSAARGVLGEPSSGAPYAVDSGEVVGQVVHELEYLTGPRRVRETQHVHVGTTFAGNSAGALLSTVSSLPSREISETTLGADQRVVAQSRSMLGYTLAFTYPPAQRTTDLLPGTVLRAIVMTDGAGTTRRYEYDVPSGRLYSMITTAVNSFEGRPRATHATGENSGIGGIATTDVEPEWLEIYNIHDGTCICSKPIEQQHRSRRAGQTHTRTWNFTYDPATKLVLTRREPNPQSGAGPFSAQVQWTYTYTQLNGGGAWGAWVPQTESTPDGVYTYAYANLLTRAGAGHGQMARTVTRSLPGVRLQDTLTGPTVASSVPVVTTIWRNLANLPASLPKMGLVNGQLRQVTDGDGVVTTHEYDNAGRLVATIVGDVRTAWTPNAAGNDTSVTTNATSTLPALTQFGLDLGTGARKTEVCTASVPRRETRSWYDRFGHLAVTRQNNLSSGGTRPAKHGVASSTARDWVERQWHFHHDWLMAEYTDRKPLDEAAGGNQFLVTAYDRGTDGRVTRTHNSNGSSTWFDFDGYGTLYRRYTKNPAGTKTVPGPKSFVGPFLDMTGTYENTGVDGLWTFVSRNAAGAITQIQEPATQPPAGYTPLNGVSYSTGGAIHTYDLDPLGRVITAESWSGATLLASRQQRFDQLGRKIWQHELDSAAAEENHMAWRYVAGAESRLLSYEVTGIAPTTYTWNTNGLPERVRDGYSTGNVVDFRYHANTPFLASLTRTDLDPSGTPRVVTTTYGVDPFGQTLTIANGAPQLVETYGFTSLGRIDKHTDPAGKVRRFLADGLGRTVERASLGDGGDSMIQSSVFEDSGFGDGRTKVTRYDALGTVGQPLNGHATITHHDFAGRLWIVQNPGGDVEPSDTTKNRSLCLYAEYDGASRLAATYDGDLGKTEYTFDGPGRVIQRRLVNQVIDGNSSEDNIAQWNTLDWLRRDALGRVRHHDYWGTPTHGFLVGLEQFDYDGLQRLTTERYMSVFAPTHVVEVASSFVDGRRLRTGLSYQDNLGSEPATLTFGHDAIGRLETMQWDRAAGAVGSTRPLAEYGWAGTLRRERTVHVANVSYPQVRSAFAYDSYDRLTQIADRTSSDGITFTTVSQFDYEYDVAGNLTKERYTKVGGRVGDRFGYDAYHRLTQAWMGVVASTMNATSDPASFDPNLIQTHHAYVLDKANNRDTSSIQTGAAPQVTDYALQGLAHAQGASNRYDTVQAPGAGAPVVLEYDSRGNLKYDGRFVYRYDFMNRLQEVWRVLPNDTPPEDGEKFGVVEDGALDEAQAEVKLEVPDIYSRLAREHTDPAFRARLRATISGGVVRIAPTASGGGGRPGFLPVEGQLELAAVYVYDAFNRRTLSVLVDPDFAETQIHTWDAWRQVVQHRLELVSGVWVGSPVKQFVWGARLDELVAYRRRVPAGWENYFVVQGGQDSAARLVDSSGAVVERYECDPFGRVDVFVGSSTTPVASSSYGLPFLWKGLRLEEITGLVQMRHRHYAPELGRFLTRDPLGEWGDPFNLGNGLAYCGNEPLAHGDPMGLATDAGGQNPQGQNPQGQGQGGQGQGGQGQGGQGNEPKYPPVDPKKDVTKYNCSGLAFRNFKYMSKDDTEKALKKGTAIDCAKDCPPCEIKIWYWTYAIQIFPPIPYKPLPPKDDFHIVGGDDPKCVVGKNGPGPIVGPKPGGDHEPPDSEPLPGAPDGWIKARQKKVLKCYCMKVGDLPQ